MAITITWPTPANGFVGTIFVPKADTTLVSLGPPEIRTLDVNTLRGDVGNLWGSEEGGPYYQPFVHNGEVTISGLILARQVTFNYFVEFENGSYTIQLTGANHNIADVQVQNSVGIVVQNSAGLIRDAANRGIIST